MEYITVLSIAGSDCSGGAGIQADIKTLSALGCYAATAITAITVQNTQGVQSVYPLPSAVVAHQLEAVAEDIHLCTVKIGMVTDEAILSVIADFLSRHAIPAIFDPVLVSSSGFPLITSEARKILIDRLIPHCMLITPNIPEAEFLCGTRIQSPDDMLRAAIQLRKQGAGNVLIKGGHLSGNDMTDVLVTRETSENIYYYHTPRIVSDNTHGTGCTLSSAIAAYVARQYPLPIAVEKGKNYLTQALRKGKDISIGRGHGPLNHFFYPEKLIIK